MQAEWAISTTSSSVNAVATKSAVADFQHVVLSIEGYVKAGGNASTLELKFGSTVVHTSLITDNGRVSIHWPDGLTAAVNEAVELKTVRPGSGDVSCSLVGSTIGG